MPVDVIKVEAEYKEFISEILSHYSLPVELKFVEDVFKWQEKHNCLMRESQSPFTPAAAVKSDGSFLILVNKEIKIREVDCVTQRIKKGNLLIESRDLIKHLILHEICHIIIAMNENYQLIDDICDAWAFYEMGLLKPSQ